MHIKNTSNVKIVATRSEVIDFLMAHVEKTHDVAGMDLVNVRLTEEGFSVEFTCGSTISELKFDTGNR